ncbi:hypothetical protein [Clostridium chromiireducens]|uniref:Uncharacterized protein n=1 Tax=Clostridium chromiireducens TaxID=225345 RepID=A0A1V4IL17_9CLOT|nr:hypothetical protein [Clostridium chromiireducens]OPJ60435.1 hypothetical protein CLCHR_29210 [Clostridium chromiireducens]
MQFRSVIKTLGDNEEILDILSNFDLKNIVILGIDYGYLIKKLKRILISLRNK